jgi:hypothetical protein
MKKPKNKNTKAYAAWEVRKLKSKILRLWKEVVKLQAGGVCEVLGCGRGPEGIQAHHIEDFRLCAALRYDPVNGLALCPKHHKMSFDSFHRSFVFAWLFMNDRPHVINYLTNRRKDVLEVTNEYLEKQIFKLKEIKELLLNKK